MHFFLKEAQKGLHKFCDEQRSNQWDHQKQNYIKAIVETFEHMGEALVITNTLP